MAVLLSILCAVLLRVSSCLVADGIVNVPTTGGVIRCKALPSGVTECLGLPFAKPPIGSLRWQAPQDLTHLPNGSHDATAFGPSCPQAAGQLLNASATSEDCLTLNLWTPPSSTDGPVAILVFFYGGGYSQGGSSTFNGSVLAAKHGVAVATVNYRVGALGFAAIGWYDDVTKQSGIGNFGFMDQQSALRWIHKEAASFGVDRTRVTIFGQSAGADSVDVHLLMPSSRGLFSRAILESGGVDAVEPLNFSLRVADAFARRLGCNATAMRTACLRNQSVASILKAQGPASGPSTAGNPVFECGTVEGCRSFKGVADNSLLLGTAFELTQRGMVNSEVDIIAGTNTLDGSLFAVGYYDTVNVTRYGELMEVVVTKTSRLKGQWHVTPDELRRALKFYPAASTSLPTEQQTKENVASLSRVLTDWPFVCGTRLIANASRHAGRQAWLYRFDYNATWQRPCYNSWGPEYGNATHTAELSFVFGHPVYLFGPPTLANSCSFTKEEAAFADRLGSIWATFAKDGAPPSSAGWPQWDIVSDRDLVLTPASRTESSWRRDVCNFWLDSREDAEALVI